MLPIRAANAPSEEKYCAMFSLPRIDEFVDQVQSRDRFLHVCTLCSCNRFKSNPVCTVDLGAVSVGTDSWQTGEPCTDWLGTSMIHLYMVISCTQFVGDL